MKNQKTDSKISRLVRPSRSHLAALPAHIREELHRKLHDGWPYTNVRQWLFAQIADRDIPALNLKTGDPYSLIWTRTAKDHKTAEETCRYRIAQWHRTHHLDWLQQLQLREQSTALLDRVQRLTAAANHEHRPGSLITGGDIIIRSLVIDALKYLHSTTRDPVAIARLTQAWIRLTR
jgi:hypothetical protein